MQEARLELPAFFFGYDSGSCSNNDGATTAASPAYPRNSLMSRFHLGYRALALRLSDLFSDGNFEDTTNSNTNNSHRDHHNNDVIRCFCLPCIKCGHGNHGRSNVKTIFGLIFVPFFLLTFFLFDDIGRVIVQNMQLRQGIAPHMSNRDDSGVIDFHVNRRILKEFPGYQREVLLLSPSVTFQGVGHSHSFEALIKCPRGILFMFHGCGRYAASFFYSPQGRKMVEMATEMGLGIVAFTKSEELGCWNWANDGDTVKKLAKKFLSSRLSKACAAPNGSDAVYPPLYAFGASSGGSFVGMLSSQMKQDPEDYSPFLFSAVNIQIMAPNPSDHWDIPTVFTVMRGDIITSKLVKDWTNQEVGKDHYKIVKDGDTSVVTQEMPVGKGPYKIIETSGRKSIINSHFAHVYQDDPEMLKISGNIHQDLSSLGIVDASTGELLDNPRFSKDAVTSIWQKYDLLTRKEMANDSKHKDASDVHPFGVSKRLMRSLKKAELEDADSLWLIEELNVAWDEHEITAEGFEDVLAFFLENGSALLVNN